MPLLLLERLRSRKATISVDSASSSVKLEFLALGTMDDGIIHNMCQNMLPITYKGMFFQSYQIDPQGGGIWYVDANYSPLQPKKPGESVYSFETAGGTAHVNVSKATVAKYSWKPNVDPPDFQGAIGVNGETVEGVDIHVPVFTFSETHFIPVALITGAYKVLLFTATAKFNAFPWKGFKAGEVLFLGAQGSIRGTDFWEISYKFAASPNDDNVEIGNSGNKVSKWGWEYVWSRFEEKVDPKAVALVKVPTATYVERVYDEFDMSLLGIGI